MELTEGSEDQAWFCNFCKRYSRDFEEKVQAWRCPQDIRDLKEQIGHIENTTRPLSVPIRTSATQARLNTAGCDYDICNQCIKEYRVRLQHIQRDIKAFLAKATLLLYCSLQKKPLNFIRVRFSGPEMRTENIIFRFFKTYVVGEEENLPETIKYEAR